MRTLTLIPAYGRDYGSQKAVAADFAADKDFIVQDVSCRWDGKMVNRMEMRGHYNQAHIRYSRLTKLTVIKI